jgi:glycogen debranching enzyme
VKNIRQMLLLNYMDDIGAQLPSLLPGEEIVNGTDFPAPPKHKLLSSIKALQQLTGVSRLRQIGSYGPAFAANALPGRDDKSLHQYEALFGRDSLRVALDLLDRFPKLARTTLVVLAELQGIAINDASEEEPGRIVHEVRDFHNDPIAQRLMRDFGWKWPYYGSVDATPEFVRLLVAYCRRTHEGFAFLDAEYVGRDGMVHTMSYALIQAIDWVTYRLDMNTDGLLEFKHRNPKGIENQVWKDSWDSYFHADGTIANHEQGIASVEVQRVAYDALLDAADLYEEQLKNATAAAQLRERAERLRLVIMSLFWTDDKGGYFIIGVDRDANGVLRQLKVRASDMGHLLHSRLLMGNDPNIRMRREQLIKQLFSPELLCLNGIRTLATDEVRFRPGAYHNGSCWGWDNYLIAQGLNMHGYVSLADYLEQLIVDGVDFAGRFVEFLRGSDDQSYRINARIIDVWDATYQRINRLEQPPQEMQAWTVAAVLAIKLEREKRGFSRRAADHITRGFEGQILSDLSMRPHTS